MCSTADLDLRLIPQCEPLWKQFRHMGRVHENYLSTLTFGQVKFDTLGGSYDGKASKLDLNDYFERLEKCHCDIFANIRSDQVVSWFGDDVRPIIHLSRLLAYEMLHHGQLILYWRVLGYSFSKSWANWGEH